MLDFVLVSSKNPGTLEHAEGRHQNVQEYGLLPLTSRPSSPAVSCKNAAMLGTDPFSTPGNARNRPLFDPDPFSTPFREEKKRRRVYLDTAAKM